MGGPGSGKYERCNAKNTTEMYHPLDIRRLHREGHLTPGNTFGWVWYLNGYDVCSVTIKVEKEFLVFSECNSNFSNNVLNGYPVGLTWTSCNYGGSRPWFRCPFCGQRVALLYGAKFFACRHCYALAYDSQREGKEDRTLRRANNIRQKLGWRSGIAYGPGHKPKGMHWRTFEQIASEYDSLTAICFHDLAEQAGMLTQSW